MEEEIQRAILGAATIAVVGLSPNPGRASHRVAMYLQQQGYRVIPVNPKVHEVLGEQAYPDLESVPDKIDVVDIFRRSEHVPAIVESAIKVGAKVVWMQEGVVSPGAAARAEQAGLLVVMDRCLMIEHYWFRGSAA